MSKIFNLTYLQIFSSALTIEDMQNLTKPETRHSLKEGDLLRWQDMQTYEHGDVTKSFIKTENLLSPKIPFVFVNVSFSTLDKCIQHCDEKVGGRVPTIISKGEYEELVEFLSHYENLVWLSVKRSELGLWTDTYTGETVDHLNFEDEDELGETAIQYKNWTHTMDALYDEYYAKKGKVFCVCSLQPVRLKGLPLCMDVTRLFMPMKHPSENNRLMFRGYGENEIHSNLNHVATAGQSLGLKGWINMTSSTLVRSEDSDVSKIFGKRNWTLLDGQPLCGEYYPGNSIELMLTRCPRGNFTCNDGQCLPFGNRCNNVIDCRDESDEEECKSLVLKRSYNKFSAPITNVTVNISLQDIASIRESENEITLKIAVTLKWTESRATYQNLKDSQAKNTLQRNDIEKLWIPKLIFQNSKEKYDTTSDISKTKLFILKDGNVSWSSSDVIEDIAIFKGSENPLIMTLITSLNFKCDYNFMLFPFDTQVNLRKC